MVLQTVRKLKRTGKHILVDISQFHINIIFIFFVPRARNKLLFELHNDYCTKSGATDMLLCCSYVYSGMLIIAVVGIAAVVSVTIVTIGVACLCRSVLLIILIIIIITMKWTILVNVLQSGELSLSLDLID